MARYKIEFSGTVSIEEIAEPEQPRGEYQLGVNVGMPGRTGYARQFHNMGPYQSFYIETDNPRGEINELTGMPVSGKTRLTVYFYPEVYPSGRYVLDWNGPGRIDGNTSPIYVVVDDTTPTQRTFNCEGEIHDLVLHQVTNEAWALAPVAYYAPTTRERERYGTCNRIMSAWRVNEDGGSSGSEYNQQSPSVRKRVVAGGMTHYHRLMTPSVIGGMGSDFDKDLWLCFHHRASPNNITDAIDDIVRAGFNRRLYVESSNEVWNSVFPQYHDTLQSAKQDGGYDTPGDASLVQAHQADRASYLAQMAKEVYPKTIGVVGGQTDVPSMVNMWAKYSNNRLDHLDLAGVTWYFGNTRTIRNADRDVALRLTGADLAEIGYDDLDNRVFAKLLEWRDAAREHGLDLGAYEGGPHFEHRSDKDITAHYAQLSQSPEVGEVVGYAMDWWQREIGTGPMLLYEDVGSPSKPWSFHHGELGAASPRWKAYTDRSL